MSQTDYYQTLGVKPDADAGAIKAAYRRLARKFHPDVSKEKNAELRFKEIGEAYAVLSDENRRREYDAFRAAGGRGPFRSGGETPYPDLDPEFLNSVFGAAFGDRAGTERRSRRRTRRGVDVEAKLTVSLEELHAGETSERSFSFADGSQRRLRIKLPSNADEGQRIRLRGQGASAEPGGEAGDLLVELVIQQHPHFERLGRDTLYRLPLAPWEAAEGLRIEVPTLAGAVMLSIPAAAQSGRRLRLRGRGLPGDPPGDHLVELRIVNPPHLNAQARALLSELAKVAAFDPRAIG